MENSNDSNGSFGIDSAVAVDASPKEPTLVTGSKEYADVSESKSLFNDLEEETLMNDGKDGNGEEDDQDDDDDDELTQDWALFLKQANIMIPNTSTASVVPKRGEKGYEPNKQNKLDDMILQNKRHIMYATISQPRGHFYKNHMEAFVLDDLSKFLTDGSFRHGTSLSSNPGAVIFKPKGAIMNNMGYRNKKNHAFLNFEEILYIIERGSCQCHRYVDNTFNTENIVPLSLQLSYACLLKKSGDQDWYFVYSYLKRYGFVVRRHQDYQFTKHDSENGKSSLLTKTISLCNYFLSLFDTSSWISRSIYKLFDHRFSWYSVYQHLKIVDFRHAGQKSEKFPETQKDDPFQIVYNIWKPNTGVKVPQRGPLDSSKIPDYQLLIVNINRTQMPSLQVLNSLMDNCDRFYSRSNCLLLAIIDNGLLNFVKVEKSSIGRRNIFLKNMEKLKNKNTGSADKKNRSKGSKSSSTKKPNKKKS